MEAHYGAVPWRAINLLEDRALPRDAKNATRQGKEIVMFSLARAPHPSIRKVSVAIRHLRENRYDALGMADCLRCGAKNVLANHICGACGASLPRVFDDDGTLRRGTATRIQTSLSSTSRHFVWLVIVLLFVSGVMGIVRGCAKMAAE